MSKEYGMDSYDDSYDWQQSKDRRANKPNGTPVLVEETPVDFFVPEVTKARFLRTARALAELPTRPNYIAPGGVAQIILRGLRYALTIEPSAKARNLLLDGPYQELTPITEIIEPNTNGIHKFMTLDDVHAAASRELVGAR